MISQRLQKTLFSFLLLFLMFSFGKNQQKDIWIGSYAISTQENPSKSIDTLIIKRAENININEVASKYQSDLMRWEIFSKNESNEKYQVVRRFLANDENNEYKQFGWENLNKTGKMNCIDGGHFFICQSEPKTLIQFGKEESHFSETGIFGIWLHKGLVNFKRIDD